MKKIVILLITLMVIIVGFLCGCTEQDGNGGNTNSNTQYHSVILKVTGSTRNVSLTYNLDGTIHNDDFVNLLGSPWEKTISSAEKGEWYYIYAKNNADYGVIEATLIFDGEIFQSDTSWEPYGDVSVGKYV